MGDTSEMNMGFCKGLKYVQRHLNIMSSLGNEANEKYHVYMYIGYESREGLVCVCVCVQSGLCRVEIFLEIGLWERE